MDVEHPHAEVGGCRAGARDGIGNVVVFEIEKYTEAAFDQFTDEGRAAAGEQFLADLEDTAVGRDALDEGAGLLGRGIVKCDDDA